MSDETAPTDPAYTARVLGSIDNGKGYWNHLRVGVFRGADRIGEYVRNYSALYKTFFPFERDGKWYALYSKHYTATRVMSLPDCTDLGGEDPAEHGFCPVEFHVPELTARDVDPVNDPDPRVANHDIARWALEVPAGDGAGRRVYWPDDKDHPQPDEAKRVAYLKAKEESHAARRAWDSRHPFTTRHANWGFVAGCHWGDDSSWKVQFLDLTRAPEGVIVRDDRFGHIELPRDVDLKNAIDTESIYERGAPPERTLIHIAVPVTFDLTGKRCDDR